MFVNIFRRIQWKIFEIYALEFVGRVEFHVRVEPPFGRMPLKSAKFLTTKTRLID